MLIQWKDEQVRVVFKSKSPSAQADEQYKHTHASVYTCAAPSSNKMSALLEKHLQKYYKKSSVVQKKKKTKHKFPLSLQATSPQVSVCFFQKAHV